MALLQWWKRKQKKVDRDIQSNTEWYLSCISEHWWKSNSYCDWPTSIFHPSHCRRGRFILGCCPCPSDMYHIFDNTNVLITLLSIFLQAVTQHACRPKVSYRSDSLCFFLPIEPKWHAQTPAFCRYPFHHDPPSPCCVLAQFRMRGVWCHCWDVSAHRNGR